MDLSEDRDQSTDDRMESQRRDDRCRYRNRMKTDRLTNVLGYRMVYCIETLMNSQQTIGENSECKRK
jgi:hypothetical protein